MSKPIVSPQLVWITPVFAVSAALTAADFPALAAAGIKAVISNRPDGESADQLLGKREAGLAWQSGMLFRHVPAAKHDLFTDSVVEGMADALRDLKGPIVAHCASGLRSAIVWAAASARSQPVDCVLEALAKANIDLGAIRDDLEAQADRKRWLGGPAAALDCECGMEATVVPLAAATR